MDYFNTNINNIDNNNLYDFLLSLVNSVDTVYDYNGNILYRTIFNQQPLYESRYSSEVQFNEEDCKKGIYTFVYNNIIRRD